MFAYKVTSVALALYLQWMCIIIFSMLVLLPILTNLHAVADTNKNQGKRDYLQPLAGSNVFNLFFLSSTPKN